jgi:hypothetical protein
MLGLIWELYTYDRMNRQDDCIRDVKQMRTQETSGVSDDQLKKKIVEIDSRRRGRRPDHPAREEVSDVRGDDVHAVGRCLFCGYKDDTAATIT